MTATTDTPSAASATARQNTLSSRITSVLSTSYSDSEIREAIAILDLRQFDNTSDSRRNLRLDVQEEVVRRNADILDDFKGVADELRRVEISLSRLTATCAAMRTQIQVANKTTAPVLDETATLFKHKREAEAKEQVLMAFQKHFLLSDAEIASLTSTSEPVDSDFFTSLNKLKRVHADSHLLLSSANDRLGLSILETSSKTLNSAFQKLFRWTQREFKTLDLENPRLGAVIRTALRILAERPQLFAESLDNFASAREETLSDSFQAALTGQGDAIVGKPIEFQAHDPLRYISDMLAWVHSATVSEREALEVLFIGEGEELAKGIQEGRANDPFSRRGEDEDDVADIFDGRQALNDLVSRNTAGIARQLRQRTEQVIQSQEESLTAYKISNLVKFYISTFHKLLGQDADMSKTLRAIDATAQRQFRDNVADHVSSIQAELNTTPTDLSPPEFLIEALETLRLLLKSYDTSLALTIPTATTDNDDNNPLNILLKAALDPYLEACHQLWTKLPPPQTSILALNCLLEVRSCLSSYDFTNTTCLSTLDPQLRHHAALLTEHQHAYLLSASGIAPLLAASTDGTQHDNGITSTIPPVFQDTQTLRTIARKLDEFLPNALLDAMERLDGLRSARLMREVTEDAAERFCEEFAIVEDAIVAIDAAAAAAAAAATATATLTTDERNGTADAAAAGVTDDELDDNDTDTAEPTRLRDIFPRTTHEIRVLLS